MRENIHAVKLYIDSNKLLNDEKFAKKVEYIIETLSKRGFYSNGYIQYSEEQSKEVMSILESILPYSNLSK